MKYIHSFVNLPHCYRNKYNINAQIYMYVCVYMVDLYIEQSSHFVDLSIYNKNFNISDETVLHVYICRRKYMKK